MLSPAPYPRSVVRLNCVVQNPSPKTRFAARWVERLGPFKQVVKAFKSLGPINECCDVPGLFLIDARGDVDEGNLGDEFWESTGEEDRDESTQRHADKNYWRVGELANRIGDVGRHVLGIEHAAIRPVRVPMARQIKCQQRTSHRQCHGVISMSVLGSAVQQDD